MDIQKVEVEVEYVVVDENNKVRGRFVTESEAFDWSCNLQDRDNKIYSVKEITK